ncbi:ATP-binding protein [Sandarakinorhabdus oryzae]|uniref:ATP-binding protein n=1 Tax=Sandarakinorhabdus oryzae TaxID=2675220 RepID=UPI0012E2AC3C|nr:winged helix-turn-helix domain-containing protein [Sandarakinorhabdus oryzae]
MASAQIKIGSVVLDCEAMELHRDGRKLPLGARACRILHALAKRPGQIVSASELMSAAWPNMIVEDVNLRVQIASIRKILSSNDCTAVSIKTVPREGYVLVASRGPADGDAVASGSRPFSIPRLLAPLIGRSEALSTVSSLMTENRIVTITGAAGIGKTSLALAAAGEWASAGRETAFVDLAAPMSSSQVAGKVYTALELDSRPQDVIAGIVRALKSRQLLLVIDNCEHVLEGVAETVRAIATGTDGVTILATSRESLNVAGEHVFPLGPLSYASSRERLNAATARTFPAIELFASSARARGQEFPVHDGNASHVAEICRRLDGIPLAIKLAAASCSIMTVGELARGLDDRFAFLTHGERSALPHHRTLQAAIDWGYDLLSESEARVFRGLGAFRNAFSLSDAQEVAGGPSLGPAAFADAMASLVAKSLVATDLATEPATFRLLETNRIYALLKLEELGERESVAQRHALYTLKRLVSANAMARADGIAMFRRLVDDWRGAHDHAVGSGQHGLALSLLRQAIAVSELHMGSEFVARADATFALADENQSRQADLDELAIRIFYAMTISQVVSIVLPSSYARIADSSRRALHLAKTYDLFPEQLNVLWTLIYSATGRADMHELRRATDEFVRTASLLGDAPALATAGRVEGGAAFWLGDFDRSLQTTTRSIANPRAGRHSRMPEVFAHYPAALTMRALALWATGRFEEARTDIEMAATVAEEIRHAPTKRWLHVVGRIPIAVWSGEFELSRRLLGEIDQLATETSNPGWVTDLHNWELAISALEETGGSYGSPSMAWRAPTPWQADMQTTMHCCFHRPSDMARIKLNGDHWCAAEHFRAAGEQLLGARSPDYAEVKRLFLAALAIADRQNAVAWQIRARVSLARLYRMSGDPGQIAQILQPVFDSFASDSLNADVRIAWALA